MQPSAYLEQLKKKGLKMTAVRRHLIELFTSISKPLSAAYITSELKKNIPSLNKTTIYRELAVLVNLGILCEEDFQDGKKHYELDPGDHHHHLVCTACSSIATIALSNDLQNTEIALEKKHQFTITDHALTFYGLCRSCQ